MIKSFKKVLTNPAVWIAAIYLLFPTDIIPDAVPVAGTLDDLVVMILTLVIQDIRASKK